MFIYSCGEPPAFCRGTPGRERFFPGSPASRRLGSYLPLCRPLGTAPAGGSPFFTDKVESGPLGSLAASPSESPRVYPSDSARLSRKPGEIGENQRRVRRLGFSSPAPFHFRRIIVKFTYAALILLTSVTGPLAAAALPPLLLHYNFDHGTGNQVLDLSGTGLNGRTGAKRAASPSGKALVLDGTPKTVVHVMVPPSLRFGRRSWSFSAWVNPKRLSLHDRQNQRRLFAFGTYPDAYLVIDITGRGRLTCYFCYRNEKGKIISTGADSALHLKTGQWAHVAIVCNRRARKIWAYVNGYCRAPSPIPPRFRGDFRLSGKLTLGSEWHNYMGLLDEVRIYRGALTPVQVWREFTALRKRFGVVESQEAIRARRQAAVMNMFQQIQRAWTTGDFGAVRELCHRIIAAGDAPAPVRSCAHLRLAQSYLAEGNPVAARSEYERIQKQADYPAVHRAEAAESIREIDHIARGLPARDPRASRYPTPRLPEHWAAEFFVAPNGNDRADGSLEHPFATPARARSAVRQARADGRSGPMCVTLLPGVYPVTRPFRLEEKDSGTPESPVVYRAATPGAARLYGGKRLRNFQLVTDPRILERLPAEARGKVYQTDIRAQGVTDFGALKDRGFGIPNPPPTVELYFNGRPMTLARWPNHGFVGISKLMDPGSKKQGRPAVFQYISDRPSRWSRAADPWLFGYFRYLWADAAIEVGRIDPRTKTITTARPYPYGDGMSTRQGIRYYAFNLLEEIDMPGEWYLDRKTGLLYFYPPADPNQARVEIGVFPGTMLTLDRVSDVRIQGLVFDLGRYNGIRLNHCERCLILGCSVSRMAGNGIMIHGGHEDAIVSSDIYLIGRRATEVIGGDRKTLSPGRHLVENCRIHDFGRIDRTYTPAVQLEGAGNRVAHNLMYNAPSSVMRIEGNDHIIEFNDVWNAVFESDDQGSMELYGNPTYRGVVFRYNRYRNIGKPPGAPMVHGQAAIRFDDAISGMLVYGNVFINGASGHFGAVQINSGRDNIIDNNLFIDCKQGVSGGWNPGNAVWRWIREKRRRAGFFLTPLYFHRYPEMAHMLDAPGINHLWRNIFFRCGPMLTGNPTLFDLVDNGQFPKSDPGFKDVGGGDYRLKPNAPVFAKIAFHPIPFAEIGLYPSPFRRPANGHGGAGTP